MSKEKIFCIGCKYLNSIPNSVWFTCEQPNNLIETSNWLKKSTTKHLHPEVINRNNNCWWFEPTIRSQVVKESLE